MSSAQAVAKKQKIWMCGAAPSMDSSSPMRLCVITITPSPSCPMWQLRGSRPTYPRTHELLQGSDKSLGGGQGGLRFSRVETNIAKRHVCDGPNQSNLFQLTCGTDTPRRSISIRNKVHHPGPPTPSMIMPYKGGGTGSMENILDQYEGKK